MRGDGNWSGKIRERVFTAGEAKALARRLFTLILSHRSDLPGSRLDHSIATVLTGPFAQISFCSYSQNGRDFC